MSNAIILIISTLAILFLATQVPLGTDPETCSPQSADPRTYPYAPGVFMPFYTP